MRRPLKLTQFHIWHLLVVITVVGIFIQPAQVVYHWIVENRNSEPPPVVVVPDGGTVIIGGIVLRPNGKRRSPNRNRILNIGTLFLSDAARDKPPARDVESPSKAINLIITPRIIIQDDEDETLLLGPTSQASANRE